MHKKRSKRGQPLSVEATTHPAAKRLNIPTAENAPLVPDSDRDHPPARYPRNPDLDPQLMWRGKDEQNWSDLVVPVPPLHIQEKVRPKALIEDLLRETKARRDQERPPPPTLFGDFNGLPEGADRTDFYQHQGNWSNRMILGDSLRVMASLAEREGLRGKVQCIYLDPPYGIRFNSNFQWSTTSRDVKDGKPEHISRDPEQVKAFRDTWQDGIHSYLTYLRDRLTVARDLLTESGSIFVQIGDENVHRVRAVMDEVFGESNCLAQITFRTSSGRLGSGLDGVSDYLLWYAMDAARYKYRPILTERNSEQLSRAFNYAQMDDGSYIPISKDQMKSWLEGIKKYDVFQPSQTQSQSGGSSSRFSVTVEGKTYQPPAKGGWRSTPEGFERLERASRLYDRGSTVRFRLKHSDYPFVNTSNIWMDTVSTAFGGGKAYVVETNPLVIQRCILMTTDPGDLVLDPTCGSGTTAYVAEQWGRRWITVDTSRVALALARARLMGARYPYYTLADSPEGQQEEARLAGKERQTRPTYGDIRQGFVYQRVPHITLRAIANNREIDTIWEERQPAVEDALAALNRALRGHSTPFQVARGARKRQSVDFTAGDEPISLPNGDPAPANGLLEWEVPAEPPDDWPEAARSALVAFREARIARQREMDASIARQADFEVLYDKPVEDRSRVRVAGPFTVESLAPHRALAVDEQGAMIPRAAEPRAPYGSGEHGDFASMILENLQTAGVQQADRKDRIEFTSLEPWPGELLAAVGHYQAGSGPDGRQRRAGLLIGPEFGTISRADLVGAAREAVEMGFDVVVSCAFAYDAHATELRKLGKVPILKARMNADLHMAKDLRRTRKGEQAAKANLFVIFGEPDIAVEPAGEDGRLRVRLHGVDVFDPRAGKVRSDGAEGIACWFLDTDYDGESFFVRHAYFPGTTSDPYKALRTTLKAEIDEEAWESLRRDVSRPFPKPASGRIAVKVINHLGDEAMQVFRT